MGVLVPRIRTVGIRLSEDEHSALEKYCRANGARSVADMARNAVLGLVTSRRKSAPTVSTVNENDGRLRDLEQKVEALSLELTAMKNILGAGEDKA